ANAAKNQGDFPESKWVESGSQQEAAKSGETMASGEKGSKQVANGTLKVAKDGERGTYTVGQGDNLWSIAGAEA
ncbi:MAG: hypothetical protein ABEJ96_10955, partial [Thiohalorhabdaceae bacterium]